MGSPSPGDNPLEGTAWVLVTLNGTPVLAGSEITIVFGDSDNLSGSSGCNTYNGTYQVSGSALSVGPLSGTNSLCVSPEGIMEQETLYKSTLSSATGFQATANQLTIRSSRGTLVYSISISPY